MLLAQKQKEAGDKLKDEILEELVKKSKITVPELLLDDQIKHLGSLFFLCHPSQGLSHSLKSLSYQLW